MSYSVAVRYGQAEGDYVVMQHETDRHIPGFLPFLWYPEAASNKEEAEIIGRRLIAAMTAMARRGPSRIAHMPLDGVSEETAQKAVTALAPYYTMPASDADRKDARERIYKKYIEPELDPNVNPNDAKNYFYKKIERSYQNKTKNAGNLS